MGVKFYIVVSKLKGQIKPIIQVREKQYSAWKLANTFKSEFPGVKVKIHEIEVDPAKLTIDKIAALTEYG